MPIMIIIGGSAVKVEAKYVLYCLKNHINRPSLISSSVCSNAAPLTAETSSVSASCLVVRIFDILYEQIHVLGFDKRYRECHFAG